MLAQQPYPKLMILIHNIQKPTNFASFFFFCGEGGGGGGVCRGGGVLRNIEFWLSLILNLLFNVLKCFMHSQPHSQTSHHFLSFSYLWISSLKLKINRKVFIYKRYCTSSWSHTILIDYLYNVYFTIQKYFNQRKRTSNMQHWPQFKSMNHYSHTT